MEEEEEVDAKCVDDGGHHGGEENHRAAAHKLRHGRAHVPVGADWIELLKWLLVGLSSIWHLCRGVNTSPSMV